MLKRMYLDRMVEEPEPAMDLLCSSCARQLGVQLIYEKEQRPAYRMFAGAVTKKVVNSRDV